MHTTEHAQSHPELRALTRRQVAVALQVSEALVDKWIRLGKIRVLKLGRCSRIPLEELNRVMKGGLQ
jgi:excisionase family DNA binding protein